MEHRMTIKYYRDGEIFSMIVGDDRDLLEKVVNCGVAPEDVVELSCSCTPDFVIQGTLARTFFSKHVLIVIEIALQGASHDSPLQ